jgi:hypothetical protein
MCLPLYILHVVAESKAKSIYPCAAAASGAAVFVSASLSVIFVPGTFESTNQECSLLLFLGPRGNIVGFVAGGKADHKVSLSLSENALFLQSIQYLLKTIFLFPNQSSFLADFELCEATDQVNLNLDVGSGACWFLFFGGVVRCDRKIVEGFEGSTAVIPLLLCIIMYLVRF